MISLVQLTTVFLEPSVLWYVFISYLHTFNLVGTFIITANKNLFLKRAEIAKDITEANKYVETQFPDVTAWPVMEFHIPRQTDG